MKLKYSEFAEEYAYEHIYTIIFKVGGCGYRYYVEMCAELIDDFNKLGIQSNVYNDCGRKIWFTENWDCNYPFTCRLDIGKEDDNPVLKYLKYKFNDKKYFNGVEAILGPFRPIKDSFVYTTLSEVVAKFIEDTAEKFKDFEYQEIVRKWIDEHAKELHLNPCKLSFVEMEKIYKGDYDKMLDEIKHPIRLKSDDRYIPPVKIIVHA